MEKVDVKVEGSCGFIFENGKFKHVAHDYDSMYAKCPHCECEQEITTDKNHEILMLVWNPSSMFDDYREIRTCEDCGNKFEFELRKPSVDEDGELIDEL